MRWWAMAHAIVGLALGLLACSTFDFADRIAGEGPSPGAIPTLAPAVAASLEPRVREAIDGAVAAVRREPESYNRWLALGMYLAANGLNDAAISVLESAERTEGSDGRAPYFRALTYLELGRLEEAISALDAAAVASPERAQVWWRLGLASLEAGREADAEAAIDRALDLDPASAAAWAGRGRLALADGRAEDALAAFEEALRVTPRAAAADVRYLQSMRVRALQRLGRTEEAGELLHGGAGGSAVPKWDDAWRDALAARTVSLAPSLDVAVRLAQEGRLDEAIARFEALLEDHPDEPAVLFDLGLAYGMAERFQDSAEIFKKLLRLEPGRTDTHEHRARALVAVAAQRPQGERRDLLLDAIDHIDTVLKVAPERGEAIALRADAHRLAGRVDEAAADYALAGERTGEAHRWTLVAADMFLQERRFEQSVTLLEGMVEERPEHVEALRLLGVARAEAGDLEGAAAALRRVLTVDPDDAVALRLLERVLADSPATSRATSSATSSAP